MEATADKPKSAPLEEQPPQNTQPAGSGPAAQASAPAPKTVDTKNLAATGTISAIKGLMAEVHITGERPKEKEILILEEFPDIQLQVDFFKKGSAVCVNLTNRQELRCGQKVLRTGQGITVPVGSSAMGRVFNALGEPLDKGERVTENRRSIHSPSNTKSFAGGGKVELLETGLKVIDFLTPFVKGRKVGIVGGAGVGKTVLTMEMIHNVTKDNKKAV